MTPDFEPLAVAGLSDPSPDALAGAAEMLKKHGSLAAKTALLERLKQDFAAPQPNQRIEYALSEALSQAQHWQMDVAALRAVQALCRDANIRRNLDYLISRTTAKVSIDYYMSAPHSWNIGIYHGEGRDSFMDKIQQFPPGTILSWHNTSEGQDEDALFAQVQAFAFALAHGMKLERAPQAGLRG